MEHPEVSNKFAVHSISSVYAVGVLKYNNVAHIKKDLIQNYTVELSAVDRGLYTVSIWGFFVSIFILASIVISGCPCLIFIRHRYP